MIETILAATDLSERSDVALRRAVERAEALGAALHIACVVDDVMPHDMCETLCTEARARLEAFVASLGGAEPPVLHIRIGDPLAVIHAIADKIRADLLVFGVHRSRPFLDLVSATTMERLVRGGPRPVLVVRDAADAPYGQVLAGLDVSPASAAAIRLAATVAPGAEINGFHAVHIPARRL
ncbi:MAG: universal stress protein, partial [Pseudomonadota bacterium]